ncbi:MAG: four helix bundle protein [Candidatus Magasanikbacteria bacterium CG10_big_fil_rev_8_21_14_0_10_42_10]|uniref:Four helix bundle protein n=2 Tax=Candidatus Magasanikiibacteriota TaxID=1752731 RepID=A0A2H0TVG1_9BACT|nr:MAG: four helix bundle protein [Candidatus Magasanikbacteria bacterium CG10_big_fil_rev_8_21_14_0_10_42_10]PIZ92938.1 MAG: four helix bundle protein [Candidatus Magasanikbacteria bacterium CG_4_10_14_0_2_um_filter_41_10]
MQKEDLKQRTKAYTLRVIKLVQALPDNQTSWVIGKQLLRSGTSVGANYRAACRARSTAEFIAKLGIVIEEADESAFWLELIIESGLYKKEAIETLLQETNELVAIMVSSSNTARKNNKK